MNWLVRNRKPNKIPKLAHIWIDGDTACKMSSTGGLNANNYKLIDSWKGLICKNCLHLPRQHHQLASTA